ncbi:MAG: cupin domain-containing protein [Leptolyngbya sp. SIO4C1]|nr:cupin domain-containing protein [Leptolyngbya sp. SIO4C1]
MSAEGINTVSKQQAALGSQGQKFLASGQSLAMRLWQEEPEDTDKAAVSRDYETVGYVISGQAKLTVEGQTTQLSPGDSWVVPQGASHTYRILESFTAVEATHPPAREVR